MAKGQSTGERVSTIRPSPQSKATAKATRVAMAKPVNASQMRRAWRAEGGGTIMGMTNDERRMTIEIPMTKFEMRVVSSFGSCHNSARHVIAARVFEIFLSPPLRRSLG